MRMAIRLRGSDSRFRLRAAGAALALGIAIAATMAATPSSLRQPQTYVIFHNFNGVPGGQGPYGGLVLDSAGNLYGATNTGGSKVCSGGCGVVYKLDPAGNETVLHAFTGQPDGAYPQAGDVAVDAAGNVYGSTEGGGDFDDGTVFKVDASGNEVVLHSFTGGTDGARPFGGVVLDAAGNVYGTTSAGGDLACSTVGCGVVFRIDTTGSETVLHRFAGPPDGDAPDGDLIIDGLGNLYGTTLAGGDSSCNSPTGCGTVYKLSASRFEKVLYRFNGADGQTPASGLLLDSAGNLYGTTSQGGPSNGGTVYKVSPLGGKTLLWGFTGGFDGKAPGSALASDAAGNLYGTASLGGRLACNSGSGCGVVFRLSKAGNFAVLHTFTGVPGDGQSPASGVVLDSAGNIYGTAPLGGATRNCLGSGCGMAYKISP